MSKVDCAVTGIDDATCPGAQVEDFLRRAADWAPEQLVVKEHGLHGVLHIKSIALAIIIREGVFCGRQVIVRRKREGVEDQMPKGYARACP